MTYYVRKPLFCNLYTIAETCGFMRNFIAVCSGGSGIQSRRGGDGGSIEGMHRDITLHHT